MQVCEAVSHAHANLIVHRDLKPSNILVTPLDEVRLLDFGIAKLLDTAEQAPDNTGTGLRAFTLPYAEPAPHTSTPVTQIRPEERRAGKEGVSTCSAPGG